jgi:hypothetical protein
MALSAWTRPSFSATVVNSQLVVKIQEQDKEAEDFMELLVAAPDA